MGDKTGIEWTDATWNPTVGCSVCSPGCAGCYAMGEAARLARMGVDRYAGLTQDSKAGPVWTGEIRMAPDSTLFAPLRWSRPRDIFVNSMSDLFHPDLSFGQVMRVLFVIGQCDRHRFQILTKRPDRMRAFFELWSDVGDEAVTLAAGPDAVRQAHPGGRGQLFADMLEAMGEPPPGRAYPSYDWQAGMRWWPDVLPNVWLGTSAEDQPRLDERSQDMDAIAALGWQTWCSAEPLLGALDISASLAWIKGLVAGGESRPRARMTHPDWMRGLRDQCAAAGIPFFLKQWGEWKPLSQLTEAECEALYEQPPTGHGEAARRSKVATDSIGYGGASGERAYFAVNGHGGMQMFRVGKRQAGNILDGRQHQQLAWTVGGQRE